MKEQSARGTLLVLIAGALWGCMSIFVRRLTGYGFTPLQIAMVRLSVSVVCFALILALTSGKKGFCIAVSDIPLFLGLGLCSVLFFTCCYFSAIQMLKVSVAAILLYTSPIWVFLMSVLFFGEKITRTKILALGMAFAGCVLVSGMGEATLSVVGFLLGIGSGIGYALYSILGSVALRKYKPYTVTFYTFLVASVGAACICDLGGFYRTYMESSGKGALLGIIILTGVVSAVLPYLAYTVGLTYVRASRAAIIATIEPVVAAVVGYAVFAEQLSVLAILGILLILGAVVVLNLFGQKD